MANDSSKTVPQQVSIKALKPSQKGACLCGQVTYKISDNMGIFQYCHCSRCRKFTGSAHASNLFVKPDDFTWLTGAEFVGCYNPPESKYFATAFCKVCGSSLPWRSKGGNVVVIPAGTLDVDPEIRPQWNVFCDSRATWYVNPDDLPQHQQLPPRQSSNKR
jgi:hypothetical protein